MFFSFLPGFVVEGRGCLCSRKAQGGVEWVFFVIGMQKKGWCFTAGALTAFQALWVQGCCVSSFKFHECKMAEFRFDIF